jgi:hypothetical protein
LLRRRMCNHFVRTDLAAGARIARGNGSLTDERPFMLRISFSGFALLVALCTPGFAQSFNEGSNAAQDFSATQNPIGRWSYGWTQQFGSAFQLNTERTVQDGIDIWVGPVAEPSPPGRFPLVGHNGTANSVITANTVLVQPGQLLLHPGPNGEYAVLRFTADQPNQYFVSASFAGMDFVGPTTTDVHVLVDGQSVFHGVVGAFQQGPAFGSFIGLAMGSTVDFAVGFGNGNFFFDSTAVAAQITPIPEPHVSALMLVGLPLILVFARTRRWRSIR